MKHSFLRLCAFVLAAPAWSATVRYVGAAGGDFADPSNWEGGVVPGPEDTAIVEVAVAHRTGSLSVDTIQFGARGVLDQGASTEMAVRRVGPTGVGRITLAAGAKLTVTGRLESSVTSNGGIVVLEGNADTNYTGDRDARLVLSNGPAALPPSGIPPNLVTVKGEGGGTLVIETTGINGFLFANSPTTFAEVVIGGNVTGKVPAPSKITIDVDGSNVRTAGTTPIGLVGSRVRVTSTVTLDSAAIALGSIETSGGGRVAITVNVAPDSVHAQRLDVDSSNFTIVNGVAPLVTDSLQVLGALQSSVDLVTRFYGQAAGAPVTGPRIVFDDLNLEGAGPSVDEMVHRGRGIANWTTQDATLPPLRMECTCDDSGTCPATSLTFCGSFTVAGALTWVNESGAKLCTYDIIGECGATVITADDLVLGGAATIAGNVGRSEIRSNGGDIAFVVNGDLDVGNYVFFDGAIDLVGARATVTSAVTDAVFHDGAAPLGEATLAIPSGSGGADVRGPLTIGAIIVAAGSGGVDFRNDVDVGFATFGQDWSFSGGGAMTVRSALKTEPSVSSSTTPATTTFSRPAPRFDPVFGRYFDTISIDYRGGAPMKAVRIDTDTAVVVGITGFGGALGEVALGDGASLLGNLVGGRAPVSAPGVRVKGACAVGGIDWQGAPQPLDLSACVNLGNNAGIDFGTRCGNGQIDALESCDDGADWFGDHGCDDLCQPISSGAPQCGNGVVEGAEECDDGDLVEDNGCTFDCTLTPEPPAQCGDGFVSCAEEECDDGNLVDGDGCSAACVREGPTTFTWTGDTSVNPFDVFSNGCDAWSPAGVPRDGDAIVFDTDFGVDFPCSGFSMPEVDVTMTSSFGGEVCLQSLSLRDVQVAGGVLRWGTKGSVRARSMRVTGAGGLVLQSSLEVEDLRFDGALLQHDFNSITATRSILLDDANILSVNDGVQIALQGALIDAEIRTTLQRLGTLSVLSSEVTFRDSFADVATFEVIDSLVQTAGGGRLRIRFPSEFSTTLVNSALRDVETGEIVTAVECIDLGNNVGIDFGSFCGNGRVDPGETCDDGNDFFGDRCGDVGCAGGVPDACGNGVTEGAERCDDGNLQYDDGCDLACSDVVVPVCGDGRLDCPFEGCEDGNTDDGDGCSSACTREAPLSFSWLGDAGIGDPFGAGGCGAWDQPDMVPVAGDFIFIGDAELVSAGAPALDVVVGPGGVATFTGPLAVRRLVVQGDGICNVDDVVVSRELTLDGVLNTNGRVSLLPGPKEVAALRSAVLFAALELGGDGRTEVDGDIFATTLRFVGGSEPTGNTEIVTSPKSRARARFFVGDVLPGDVRVPHRVEPLLTVRGDLVLGGDVVGAEVQLESGTHHVDVTDGAVARLTVGSPDLPRGGAVLPTNLVSTTRLEGIDVFLVREGLVLLPPTLELDALRVEGGLTVGGVSVDVGELTISGGSFVAPPTTTVRRVVVAGSGFVAGDGALVLDPSSPPLLASLAGASLEDVTVRGDVAFAPTSGDLFTIGGAFTARGASGADLVLSSQEPGAPWEFRLVDEAGVDVDFVAVSDSHHVGAFFIDPVHFTDDGNNRGWTAGPAAACGALIARTGLVVLASDADVAAFNASGVQCIDGDLTIAAGVTAATLDELAVVTGTISIEGTGLTQLSAPALTDVGDLLLLDNTALASLDLSSLDRVDGDLRIEGSPSLIDVDLSELSRVGGDLVITDVGVETLDLTELDAVGGDLVVSDNVALADVDIGVRDVGGDLIVTENDALDDLDLVVVVVNGSLIVTGNDSLAELLLELLSIVGADVTIDDNDALVTADLGALTAVGGDLVVTADAIDVGDLADVGGATSLTGGDLALPDDLVCDEQGTCGPPREPDADEDGVFDAVDNCDTIPNADQRDGDGDTVGDACDRDDDDDGVGDGDDEAPQEATPADGDRDGDGVRDDLDGCPDDADAAQADPDGDGRGIPCDDDDDGDGVLDDADACPLTPGECFDDADGDGVSDAADACATLAGAEEDADGDGLGDACDADADGDDVADRLDVCPGIVDDQADGDADGFGDACDLCIAVAGSVGGCPLVDDVAPVAQEPPAPQAPVAQGCTCASSASGGDAALVSALLVGLAALRRRVRSGRRHRVVGAVVVVAAVALGAGGARAVPRTWTGAVDATWSEPGNWEPAGAPGAGDDLLVDREDALVRVDVGDPVASLTVTAGAVIIERGVFSAGTLAIAGGVVVADGAFVDVDEATLDAGVFSAPTELTVRAALSLRGGFVHNAGRVTLAPVDATPVAVSLQGTSLFDFFVDGPVQVTFAAGSRLRTEGTLHVVGDANGRAQLAGVGGARWSLDARGGVEVDVVRVADCENLGFLISPADFEDGGNNVGWGLPPALCAERATLAATVVLLNDEDVAALEATGAQCLIGDLVVGGGVTSLRLTQLQIVLGRIIVRNTAVEDVALTALQQVASIQLDNSPALASVSLPELAVVDDDLSVADDDALVLVDLPALATVGGDLVVQDDDAIVTLSVPLPQGVGGDLIVDDNDALETFSSHTPTVGGDLVVTSNDVLQTLSMASLTTVGGDLVVVDNDELVDVEMDALVDVGGDLIVNDNDALPALLLDLLQELGGSVLVVGNDALQVFSVTALQHIPGDLIVMDNGALTEVLVNALISVGDDVTILGNLLLVVLALPALQTVGGDLVVAENPLLETFSVPALQTVGGDLVITDNPVLDDIDLSALSTCGGDLVVQDNAELCVTECGALTEVSGELLIDGDPVLPRGVACGDDGRCGPIFGDGLIVLVEICDDANVQDGDGCTRGVPDRGFLCDLLEPTVCVRDVDTDTVVDATDRCRLVADADQSNTDGDGFGDACDLDDDDDGVPDRLDVCPLVPNAGQEHVACDAVVPAADDGDNDGVLDDVDVCPDVADAAQANTDGDEHGDGCDDDDDEDGVPDVADPCPLVAGECADDADGDGVPDEEDLCPTLAVETADLDGDGLGDLCDSDDDADGVPDVRDGCPRAPDPGQEDDDGDGFGDVCDRCPDEDDNAADTECSPIVPETPPPGGCAAAPPVPAFAALLLLLRRRRR